MPTSCYSAHEITASPRRTPTGSAHPQPWFAGGETEAQSSKAAGPVPTASVGKGWYWKVSLRPDVGRSEICDRVPAP